MLRSSSYGLGTSLSVVVAAKPLPTSVCLVNEIGSSGMVPPAFVPFAPLERETRIDGRVAPAEEEARTERIFLRELSAPRREFEYTGKLYSTREHGKEQLIENAHFEQMLRDATQRPEDGLVIHCRYSE
jgi:hypothetical protein